ncbi:N-acetylmuramoyl-L-alanine amidase [Anoxybacillus voinovskiensis]|uniref:N-acetylmuramoyl-L-alanine amidase n=1 Tax=Anoxybacteroides voinovskiense TaxID=230470 RepID=A0A840DQ85_9BACL|nr:N-acetylmuramoyl-L-alanine amidase [Anoxybacillus voinovskiensis]MBB4073775.1 N-acetylmuramoyl-L-alanine amidase [Anoxybacillus voinovskiensis]GGJ64007.1 putative N-acetylmuramoyl-L-alanine amidase YrvJ [Anoxybacillus voinovskiensis]
MKKWIASTMITASLLGSTFASVEAATATYPLSVKVSVANVRQNPTMTAKVVTKLKKGTAVKAIAVSTDAKGAKWYKVVLANNKTGWMHETVVKTVASNPKTTTAVKNSQLNSEKSIAAQLSINVSVANVRQSPSTSAKVLTQLKKGTVLKAIAISADAKGAKWYKVVLANNKTGWVHETVVKASTNTSSSSDSTTSSKKTVITNMATLYSAPSLSATVVGSVQRNDQVTVLDTAIDSLFNWVKVSTSSGTVGWLPQFELNYTVPKYVYAKNTAVPLQSNPTWVDEPIQMLNINDRLLSLYSEDEWLYVETPAGVRGWVLEENVSPLAVNSLTAPTMENSGEERYLEWKKTNNFNVSYTVLSGNRLKITGAFSYADIPTFSIDGIQSIEQTDASVIVTFSPGYTFTIRNYSDRLSIKIVETGLKGKKIIVDAGHGGHDTGAIGPTGLKEKEITLNTALLLKEELEKAGAIVTLTRSTDVFLELFERTAIANNSDYDAFISIHADSYSKTSTGTTTYYNVTTNFNGPKSKTLAQYVQQSLVAQLKTPNRGYKEQAFYVNRKNELPSILVELAYVSNPNEEALLKTKAFLQKAAVGIRQGLEQYFNNF